MTVKRRYWLALCWILTSAVVSPVSAQPVDPLDRAEMLNHEAIELFRQGKYAQAIPKAREAIRIREEVLSPEHLDVAVSLKNLAALLYSQGEYVEAELSFRRALSIEEKGLSPNDPSLARTLNNLGVLLDDEGQYSQAELFYQRALAIRERVLPPEHPDVAISLNNLAVLYFQLGRYADVELLFQRALAIRENALGDHPDVAQSLSNLAGLFKAQGRLKEAEPLYKRALAIAEKIFSPEHPELAQHLNALALLYFERGEYAEAEPVFRRALAIREKALGDHPEVATSLTNLALLQKTQQRYAQAEPLYQRALIIRERTLTREHPDIALSFYNLGALYEAQDQYVQAEQFYRQALAIYEKVLGATHPSVARALIGVGYSLLRQGRVSEARPFFERARRIHLTVLRTNAALGDQGIRGLLGLISRDLRWYVRLLALFAQETKDEGERRSARLDAFSISEQVRSGVALAALGRASARVAADSPAIGALVRQVDDLQNRRNAVSAQLTAEYVKPTINRNATRLMNLQNTLANLERELVTSTDHLRQAFPKQAETAAPDPIDAATTKLLLRPGEALVSYFILNDRLLIWLIRPDREPFYLERDVGRLELSTLVGKVRASMDQSQSATSELELGLYRPVDVVGSHDLFRLLLEPLQSELMGIKHLIVVPDEMLLSVPFGTLITDTANDAYAMLVGKHQAGFLLDSVEDSSALADYAKLAWLIKKYAITVLPSATALRMLRAIRRASHTNGEPFIGIGDPDLQGNGGNGVMLSVRGAAAPVAELHRLGRLQGMDDLLRAASFALKADPDNSLLLGRQATKPAVMALNESGRLAKVRVVAFATHGLIAGELRGLAQPALVLTPPVAPSEQDDGLLELDDILGLKLDNAEWVVLAGCQTAAGDGSSDGLSGLARGFFFAGARSLLVSHWRVNSKATQVLIKEVFERYAASRLSSRAEVLRQGMLAVMVQTTVSTAHFAHPYAWAPFFLVGEDAY